MSYAPDLQTVVTSAKREGMMKGWCWVVTEDWFKTEGWLLVRPFCGLSLDEVGTFASKVSEYTKSYFNHTISADAVDLTYSAALSDAIMLYAHAVTKVLSKGGNLSDGRAVTAAVRSTSFAGIGGRAVRLDKNGDRIDSYEVVNYVREEGDVTSSVGVGVFNGTLMEYEAYEQAVVWPGNTMDVPGARCWIAMGPLALDGIL